MNFSISNIGWSEADDRHMYDMIRECGFSGLEIAPTRIFPQRPYDRLEEARRWKEKLESAYGFSVPSMQSIWYGRSEKIFGSIEERNILIDHTKKAVDFAETIGCKTLVFGCPRNRSIPDDGDMEIAVRFFRELGDYAYEHHTVIAMEATPPIYNTNFLNTTEAAIEFIKEVDSKGFLLNLDTGTMIENAETVSIFNGNEHLISHVHISEPGLKLVQKRKLHHELVDMLRSIDYQRFISIEVGRQDDISLLVGLMKYVKEIFR